MATTALWRIYVQTQPINEWFGREQAARAKARTAAEKREAKAKEAAEKIHYEDAPALTEDEEWFRHHNWKAKRAKVTQALHDAGLSTNTITSFLQCGSDCQVEWSDELQRFRVIACYCHNRHCEPCMKAKSALITSNLRERMKDRKAKQFRFITLTLKHSDTPLRSQIKRLYACYRTLRGKTLWKSSQKGGAATLEVKWSPDTKKWHPHLHIIAEGTYINTYDLSQTWRDITGDSHIVDVRLISADKDVAFYVGKYVTKGTNSEVWDDPAVATEWVKAVKGVRMCATFGTWRGYKLLKREKEKPGQWKHVASLASLVRRMQNGEEHARHLLIMLCETQQYNPNRKRPRKAPA